MYDLCRKGIRYFEKADIPEVNKDRGLFYVGCLRADLKRGLYGEAVEDYEEAVQDRRNTEVCRAVMHIHGAAAYFQVKQYGKAGECCRKYLELYDKLMGNDTAMVTQGSLFVRDFFGKNDRNNACSILIISELAQGDDQAFKQYFESFGWEEDRLYINFDIIPAVIDFCVKTKYDELYVRAAHILIKRKEISGKTIQCLREREKTLPEDAFLRLARIFSQVDSDDCYIIYLRILYKDSRGIKAGLSNDLKALSECQEDFLCLPDKFWDIVERAGVDLNDLFRQMGFDRWKERVDIFVRRSDADVILRRREMWFGLEAQESADLQAVSEMQTEVRRAYFVLKTTEALLIKGKYSNSYEELYQALLGYVDINLKLYGPFFNDNAFSGKMEFLPLSCRLAVKLSLVLMQEKGGDYIAILKAYKDCMKIYPAMDCVIRQYVHLYQEKMEAEMKELAWLKEQLKGKAGQFIENKSYQEAGLILEQLNKLDPKDPDILSIEEMMNSVFIATDL